MISIRSKDGCTATLAGGRGPGSSRPRPAWLVLVLAACSAPPDEKAPAPVPSGDEAPAAVETAPDRDAVVARVGDMEITAADLREFSGRMPEQLRGEKAGIERAKNHLRTMTDREILRLEAQARGLDQSRGFLKKLSKAGRERIVGLFQAREIEIETNPEEFEEFVAREEHDRAIRFSEIIVESKAAAERARAEIDGGRSFEEVAREMSLSRATAEHGGDRGRASVKVEIDPVFRDALFSLEVGEVSRPIRFPGRLWAVVEVTDETSVKLGPMALQEVVKEFQSLKFREARDKLAAELAREYRLELNRGGVDRFLSRARIDKPFSPEEEDSIVLYTFTGGSITAGDLIEALKVRRQRPDSMEKADDVIDAATRFLVPDAVFMEAAVRSGIHEEPAVVAWLERQRRWLLIVELRASVLEGRLEVSRDEARRYFEDHAAVFADPELIVMDEILVATEEEALGLRKQIEKGAAFSELAARSERALDHRDENGRVELYAFEKAAWGGLEAAARTAPIGELMGPLEVAEGYSVFRVLSRDRRQVTFEEVERRVVATVRWLRKQRLFEGEVERIREKYASEVEIREDALASAL
ncbi:MAG: peptidyl-prolyl cis-trans isomerase [Gemmatimonadetes bacterium]|nr:peptidyl-prolyl cis-trans isomerase [Gemmatimonadota bacterium]